MIASALYESVCVCVSEHFKAFLLKLLNEGHQRSTLMGHHSEIRGRLTTHNTLYMVVYVTGRTERGHE